MAQQIVELECPGCGARVSTGQMECEYCHKPIIISSFNSVYNMPMPEINKYAGAYRKALAENPDNTGLNNSVAMCYLKLKLYDKALPAFEKAMEDNFDNSETFFYAAICLLKGKIAFATPKADIDKAIEYINSACMIEPRGVYYLYQAYLVSDFYERKHLRTSPGSAELVNMALANGLTAYDRDQLFLVLGVEVPPAFR